MYLAWYLAATGEVHMLTRFSFGFARSLFPASACIAIGLAISPGVPAFAQRAASQGGSQKSDAPPDLASFLRRYQPDPIDFDDHKGWTQIFDGKTLDGWNGSPEVWHVADGAIIGESSPEKPSGTTNIFYTRAQPGNFMLKLEIKLEGAGANGGIQYRSHNVPPKPMTIPPGLPDAQREQMEKTIQAQAPLVKRNAPWNMTGYQADLDFGNMFSGQLYEQDSKRFIVTFPGLMVEAHDGGKVLISTLGTPEQMRSYVKSGEWNQVEIIADGHLLMHLINGHIMSVTIDNDTEHYSPNGLIGFEIEGPGVVKISHRNVWLKELH
jgi:hypothetical protein